MTEENKAVQKKNNKKKTSKHTPSNFRGKNESFITVLNLTNKTINCCAFGLLCKKTVDPTEC